MDNFDLKKYLAEGKLFKEEEEPTAFTLPQVGGDTGIKLPMRKIFKMLKDAGYDPEITDGNRITGINDITIGVGDDKFSAGTLIISKNGQVFGDNSWGVDIESEDEIFSMIDEFYMDQFESEAKN